MHTGRVVDSKSLNATSEWALKQWAAWFSAQGRADLSLLSFAIWDPIGVSDSAITMDPAQYQ